jgi:two-component system chemotaxis response regulator CheB
MSSEIRVLVVDDSAFFRRRVTEMLNQTEGVQVVGAAANGLEALRETHRLKPDVITMDVEMPVMDGITAVRRIMVEIPTAILMFSSLTQEGASATLDALEAGALDFLPKQMEDMAASRDAAATILGKRVQVLGRRALRRRQLAESKAQVPTPRQPEAPVPPAVQRRTELFKRGRCELVAIGTSTGGPAALQAIITSLPVGFPVPLLLVVHMPANFTAAFAERLDRQSSISVKEAADGDALRPGLALLAPGGKQMTIERQRQGAVVRIHDADPGQIYRPSVDITFGSAARYSPNGVLAIILTGMGADGLEGARLLKNGGSVVWSQDEASCVVFGMPQAVQKAGLSDQVLSLDKMGAMLTRAVINGSA